MADDDPYPEPGRLEILEAYGFNMDHADELVRAYQQRGKVAAIKVLRVRTGISLVEAKEAIEWIFERNFSTLYRSADDREYLVSLDNGETWEIHPNRPRVRIIEMVPDGVRLAKTRRS